MRSTPDEPGEERVLVLAPLGQDARAMAELLSSEALAVQVCGSPAEASAHVDSGAGALLLTEEALELPGADELLEAFKRQPPWSELPLIILTAGGESRRTRLLDLAAAAAGSVTLLERPISTRTLLRSVEVALSSRRRQYQARDLIEAHRLSEARLRATFDHAGVGIFEVGGDEQFLAVNRRACEILGCTREQLLAMNVHEVTWPEDRPLSDRLNRELREGLRDSIDYEKRYVGADGAPVWAHVTVSPIRDSAGRWTRSIGTIEDISERKGAEAALHEQTHLAQLRADANEALQRPATLSELLQSVAALLVERLDAAFVRVWTLDAGGQTLELQASAGLYTHLDGAHSRIAVGQYKIGRIAKSRQPHITNEVIGDPEVHDQEWAKREGLVAFAGLPLQVEGRLLGVVGLFARHALSPAAVETFKAVGGALGLALARKQVEEALQRSEFFHRQTLESIPGMMFTTRPDGYCDWQSPQWVEFSGVPMEQHLGDGWATLLHPEDRPRAFASWCEAVEGRAPYDLEYRVRRHDGVYRWFKVRARPIVDPQGDIVRWFGVLLDVEDLKVAEAALAASLEEKVVLLREVHHRVKNNMQVISSLVNLQADALQDPALDTVFRDVRDRVQSMALVHEKLYRSENLAQINFAEYARSLVTALCNGHRSGTVNVRVEVKVEQPVFLTVDTAIPCGLMLNELTTNALKYAFQGRSEGTVAVSIEQDPGGEVRLAVRDDGVGLPAGLDWTRTSSLGLRLVQLLAKQLQAQVVVRQEAGTEFAVTFALHE